MQSLLEFIQLGEMIELAEISNLLEADLNSFLAKHKEAPVTKFKEDAGLEQKFDEAIKRLQAARHGLGIANRLRNPEDQKKNKARIMKNLNLLRRLIQHMEQEMSASTQDVGEQPQAMAANESTTKKGKAINEKWDTNYETPKSKKGMWDGWSKADLTAEYNKLKKSGPHKKGSKEFTRMKEVAFAIRAKKKGSGKWGTVKK
jgi:hypothetical protein